MTFGHSPHLAERSLLGPSPTTSQAHHTANIVRNLVGVYNHRVNQEEDLKEAQTQGTLQVGDLVLARVMPYGAAKLGNKYRRNIYKIIQRTGRKLKLVAQFDNLETITLHVKNVKPFRFNHNMCPSISTPIWRKPSANHNFPHHMHQVPPVHLLLTP